MWDIFCGGSVVSGENSQIVVKREVREELGISISLKDVRPILTTNHDEGFDDIYDITKEIKNSEFHLQHDEVKTVRWASLNEILELIKHEKFIPYHKELIKLLFFMRNRRGTFTKDNI